jgi:hypothetical protein
MSTKKDGVTEISNTKDDMTDCVIRAANAALICCTFTMIEF